MDKTQLLSRAASPEERMLLARVLDKYEQMDRRNIPTATPFLTQAEQTAVQALLNAAGIRSGYIWNGGYPQAERKLLQFLPDWCETEDGVLTALRARCRGDEAPTHRDFLGSLMALGLTREKFGDLLVTPGQCDLITAADAAPFLLQNWDSAGRARLQVEEIPLDALKIPVQQVKEIRDTVASLRLDAVAAGGFSMSRTRAAELIAAGRVQVNHLDCGKGDRLVAEGDVITIRGLGKCVVVQVGGQSKKGRTIIVLHRFL